MVQIEGGYFAVSGWIVATEVTVHTFGAEEPHKLKVFLVAIGLKRTGAQGTVRRRATDHICLKWTWLRLCRDNDRQKNGYICNGIMCFPHFCS